MADYVNIPMSVAVDTVALTTTVAGNLVIGGEVPVLQSKTVYPSASDQAIEPDTGYDGLEDVTVKAVVIENLDAANIVDGVTVKVGDAVDDDRIASVTGTAQTGIVPTGTLEITSNGTENCSAYEYVDVDVANSYTAGDEGKVVRSGALVSQTSATYTQNSTYDTTTVNSVTVQVEGGGSSTLGTKTINNNGTYNASSDSLDGYSQVTVSVPASAVDTGTKSITANGNNQDVVGYAAVNVNVPNSYSAGDEGKVVSSGALVAQTAHADVTPTTSDQTIDTTTNNSLKVKGDANLVAGNIKKDVEIFGVTGSYEGGGGGIDINEIADGSFSGTLHITTATSVQANRFNGMGNITEVILDNVQTIQTGSFRSMAGLLLFSGNKITILAGSDQIRDCPSLQTISMGNLDVMQGTDDLRGNSALATVDLGLATGINARTFYGCSSLNVIILRRSLITSLGNVNVFDGTPFASGGTGGTIYIPKSLYDALGTGTNDYKAASNWSTVNGYGTITWAKIEGSYYETHYADGTTIPT